MLKSGQGAISISRRTGPAAHNCRRGGWAAQSRVRVEARPRVRLALLNALTISGRHAGGEASLQRSCVHSDNERVARLPRLHHVQLGVHRGRRSGVAARSSNPARSQALHGSPAHRMRERLRPRASSLHFLAWKTRRRLALRRCLEFGDVEGASASGSSGRAVSAGRADCGARGGRDRCRRAPSRRSCPLCIINRL